MFRRKKNLIIVVHNDELIWLSDRKDGDNCCVLRLSMEKVLGGDRVAEQIPKSLKGNYRSLLIVPDHWFGAESYPFRSRKATLIEPFLERKLTNEYPELKELRNFITYRHAAVVGDGEGISAYFLQDAKGYQLYHALCNMTLCPRQITTPAFLWMEALSKVMPEFDRSGALLLHMSGTECLLYFYFNGNYLFSRSVMLSETQDRMDALTFEINQSLYMFSQKTKSELNRLYLLNGSSEDKEILNQALGREITDINSLLEKSDLLLNDDIPFLRGLLQRRHLSLYASFLHVSHRQVRHALAWQPVQWAGIFIGVLLLLPLLAENLVLERMLQTQSDATQAFYRNVQLSKGDTIRNTESKLDQVLLATEKPRAREAIYFLLASLPDGVRVKEIDLMLEGQAAISLTAFVAAEDSDHLRRILIQLSAQIRRHFEGAQDFSIGNIAIENDNSIDIKMISPYVVSFELGLI